MQAYTGNKNNKKQNKHNLILKKSKKLNFIIYNINDLVYNFALVG